MHEFLSKLGRTGRIVVVSTFALFVAAGITQAATTISTSISTAGALSVTGLSTLLGGATTTQITLLSGDTIKNATASSTVMSGTITVGNLVDSGTLAVTGATTLASTTATTFKNGQTGTQLSRMTAGYCVTAATALTASTTVMLTCTPSGGAGILTASDRVFVMATSSLPGRVYLSSASSTADGTIQVNAFNTGIDGGTVGSAAYAFKFWAFQ